VIESDSLAAGVTVNDRNVAEGLVASVNRMIVKKEKTRGTKKTRGN
jgi:hypothetical protein